MILKNIFKNSFLYKNSYVTGIIRKGAVKTFKERNGVRGRRVAQPWFRPSLLGRFKEKALRFVLAHAIMMLNILKNSCV